MQILTRESDYQVWLRNLLHCARCYFVSSLTNRYSAIIAAGLLLRLLVMPFSIGLDITLHTWISNLVAQGHIDVYRYYFQQFHSIYFPPDKPIEVAAGFPPLFYLIYGLYLVALRNLHVFNFLGNWSMANIWVFPTQNRVFFFMKAFYIPFDLLCLAALLKLFEGEKQRIAAWAWMFNPFVIYVSYIWGQTDLMAAAFILTALYLAKKAIMDGKLSFGLASCVCIGISAFFKLFPLALLPVFSLILSKHTRKSSVYFIGAGLSPFLLVLPFISKPFIDMTLPYGVYLTARNLSYGLPQFTIYIVFAAYLAILYYLYFVENDYGFNNLLTYSLATFSLLYSLSLWLPNWILWGMPIILVAILLRTRIFLIYAVLVASFFVFVQGWGAGLWLYMFRPLSASLRSFPNLWDLLPRGYATLMGLSYTIIGTSVVFVTYYTRKHAEDDTAASPWQWVSLLLIPLVLVVATMILGATYLQQNGLPIFETLANSIAVDPEFFAFYFALICVVSLWGILAATSRRAK